MLKKWKLQQVLVYSLAIIVWVNNFQTPDIQAVFEQLFRDSNDIAGGSNIGVVGGGRRVSFFANLYDKNCVYKIGFKVKAWTKYKHKHNTHPKAT